MHQEVQVVKPDFIRPGSVVGYWQPVVQPTVAQQSHSCQLYSDPGLLY